MFDLKTKVLNNYIDVIEKFRNSKNIYNSVDSNFVYICHSTIIKVQVITPMFNNINLSV